MSLPRSDTRRLIEEAPHGVLWLIRGQLSGTASKRILKAPELHLALLQAGTSVCIWCPLQMSLGQWAWSLMMVEADRGYS